VPISGWRARSAAAVRAPQRVGAGAAYPCKELQDVLREGAAVARLEWGVKSWERSRRPILVAWGRLAAGA
jgi:hypothetical protein